MLVIRRLIAVRSEKTVDGGTIANVLSVDIGTMTNDSGATGG